MGFALPNGAHVYLASGYGPAITFTGATNAEHAVITVSAADDIAVGDIVHVNCNWSGIDNVIAKIDAIAENAVTLRNINTTNKNKYAAGGGSGSIRKIEEWTELPQITEVSKSGGDQNTTQIQFLSDDRQRNLNTYKSAVSQTYSIAHDSTLPVYPLLRQLDEDEETVAAYMYVSWSDPDNAYSDAMEPVFEQALVARYGFNQLEITAIGCTRQSEANRKGRWGILTNNKDRVVTFNVGEDGNIPQPGYVIAVADRNLSGRDLGGRISAVNGRVLTLDRAPDASAADRMIVNLPSGVSQSRTIQSITGNKVTVTTAYSETPVAEAVWVIESDELYAQQYRVITVTDNNDGTFTIIGANHDPDKFDRIDTIAGLCGIARGVSLLICPR